MKRLDDPTEKVRVCAVKSLTGILKNPPEAFKKVSFKPHHDLIIDTLLTHFDDDEGSFQELISGTIFTNIRIVCLIGNLCDLLNSKINL